MSNDSKVSTDIVHFDGRPPKRGVGAIEQGSDSDGDIPSKLAEMFEAQNNTIAETNAKLQADVIANVKNLVDQRVSKVELAHQELVTKVDTLEHSQLGFAAELGKSKMPRINLLPISAWLAVKGLRGRKLSLTNLTAPQTLSFTTFYSEGGLAGRGVQGPGALAHFCL